MRKYKESKVKREGGSQNIRYWREKICDSLFLFLSIFGIIAYVPSLLLSISEEQWVVAAVDTFMYLIVIILTVYKKIGYTIRSVIGSAIFYILGVFLLVILGPTGAGDLWLFAFSLVTGLILGEKASLVSLAVNAVTLTAVYIALISGLLNGDTALSQFNPSVWLIKAVNFIVLNFIIVLSNIIFVRGFQILLRRSYKTKKATILGLAHLAEHRDSNTGQHLERIQYYTSLLAEGLSKKKEYRNYITAGYINDISLSSILHDIGKVGIQDSILLKPGKLTDEEFEIIKHHPRYGGDVISGIEKNIEGPSLYLLGREIAYYHHEKWDGTGYPEGLKGSEIPLSARIVALADVYDALTSERPYKKAFTHAETREFIERNRGKHFDPLIVDIFLEREKEFSRASEIVPEKEFVYP